MKEEHKTSSSQPEEWESRFDKQFKYVTHTQLLAGEHVVSPHGNLLIKNFIKEEIRKAEDRKDEYYQTEIKKITKECWNYEQVIEDLEALKK